MLEWFFIDQEPIFLVGGFNICFHRVEDPYTYQVRSPIDYCGLKLYATEPTHRPDEPLIAVITRLRWLP
jgi:hypothetical protein